MQQQLQLLDAGNMVLTTCLLHAAVAAMVVGFFGVVAGAFYHVCDLLVHYSV